jgi:hypothetical protein
MTAKTKLEELVVKWHHPMPIRAGVVITKTTQPAGAATNKIANY